MCELNAMYMCLNITLSNFKHSVHKSKANFPCPVPSGSMEKVIYINSIVNIHGVDYPTNTTRWLKQILA